jgi:hypothetical protein
MCPATARVTRAVLFMSSQRDPSKISRLVGVILGAPQYSILLI